MLNTLIVVLFLQSAFADFKPVSDYDRYKIFNELGFKTGKKIMNKINSLDSESRAYTGMVNFIIDSEYRKHEPRFEKKKISKEIFNLKIECIKAYARSRLNLDLNADIQEIDEILKEIPRKYLKGPYIEKNIIDYVETKYYKQQSN